MVGRAAVYGVRAEQDHRPGFADDRLGARGIDDIATPRAHRRTVIERRVAQATARIGTHGVLRHELQWPVVGTHVIDREQRLDVGAATVQVTPGPRPLVPVLDILVPVEGHAVTRHLEVRLTEQLLAVCAAEQLKRRPHQPRVGAERQQIRLCAARPDHALHHDFVAAVGEDETRAVVILGAAQPLRGGVQPLEGGAHRCEFRSAEESWQQDPTAPEEFIHLPGRQPDGAHRETAVRSGTRRAA